MHAINLALFQHSIDEQLAKWFNRIYSANPTTSVIAIYNKMVFPKSLKMKYHLISQHIYRLEDDVFMI